MASTEPPARLVADEGSLLRRSGAGEEEERGNSSEFAETRLGGKSAHEYFDFASRLFSLKAEKKMNRLNSINKQSLFRRRLLPPLVAALAVLAAVPATAELLPQAHEIALPEEKALLDEPVFRLLSKVDPEQPDFVVALDQLLARLAQPTKLRGFIQYLRANALFQQDKDEAARESVDESIRLLSGYSAPLLLGASIYGFSDKPDRAADFLIRASRIDPQIVKKVEQYGVNNILHRLAAQGDHRRIGALSERLIEIGWLGDTLTGRSSIALNAIEARLSRGDVDGAKSLVPKLVDPSDSRTLLVQNRYREVWPEVERWAGFQLESQWRLYLEEARNSWEASKDPTSTATYVWALDAAGHDDTMIRDVLPLLLKKLDKVDDHDLMFVVPKVAGALARKGRWSEIEALFDHAAKTWPLGEHTNALNIAANRARFLLFEGKTEEALAAIDAVIADAERRGDEVNADALSVMHLQRACILHALGRDEEAVLSRASASSTVTSAAYLSVCQNRLDEAREGLISALADEETRPEVIAYVQRVDDAPLSSEYGRLIKARQEALRSDPKLLAAVAKYGRILPFSLKSGAPPERPKGKAI